MNEKQYNMGNLFKSILFNTHGRIKGNISIFTYTEIIVLSLLIPCIGIAFNSDDIFFLEASFPWIVLSPLLVSLRYGTVSAVISLFLIAITMLLHIRIVDVALSQFPVSIFSAMVILSLITSSIIEAWKHRFNKLTQEKEYMEMRLKQVDNAYRILQASHAQLEDKFVDRTLSLRQSLELIQTDLNQFPLNPLNLVAQKMLDLLSQFEWLEIAAVYGLNPNGGVIDKPLVSQGEMLPLLPNDELLQRCLSEAKPSSITKSTYLQQPHKLNSNLIAVIPIVDANQKIWCVLAVRQMQFTAFHRQNINLLTLIGRYAANLLSSMKVRTKISHWKQAFVEIDAALQIIIQHRLDAHLVTFKLPNNQSRQKYCDFIDLHSAGLNQRWVIEDSSLRLLVLIPISTPKDNQYYLKTLKEKFENEFEQTFTQLAIQIESSYFNRYDNSKQLADMLLTVRQS